MSGPFISFLTDFGPDGPAAVCRGVMLAIAPDASIVDIAHGVRKFAIRDGAFLFASALPYFRVGVAVGVVDPGVGTERLPIAIRTRAGRPPRRARQRPLAAGGRGARRRSSRRGFSRTATSGCRRPPRRRSTAATSSAPWAPISRWATPFQDGRSGDRRGGSRPAAAADGRQLTTAGSRPASSYIDSFGNGRLAGRPDDLAGADRPLEPGRPLVVEVGDGREPIGLTWQRTFGQMPLGAPLLYEDSSGTISFADNQGEHRRASRPRRWTSRSGSGRPDDGPSGHHLPDRLRPVGARPSAAA